MFAARVFGVCQIEQCAACNCTQNGFEFAYVACATSAFLVAYCCVARVASSDSRLCWVFLWERLYGIFCIDRGSSLFVIYVMPFPTIGTQAAWYKMVRLHTEPNTPTRFSPQQGFCTRIMLITHLLSSDVFLSWWRRSFVQTCGQSCPILARMRVGWSTSWLVTPNFLHQRQRANANETLNLKYLHVFVA